MEAANLPTFLKFRNANKSDSCAIFAKKNYGWPQNWEESGAKLGACAPRPGLKPPLLCCIRENQEKEKAYKI